LLEYYKKSEYFDQGDPVYHGHGGPLKLTYPTPNGFGEDWISTSRYMNELFSDDLTKTNQSYGFGFEGVASYKGLRQSTFVAFLQKVMKRPNLTIMTHSEVKKILFDSSISAPRAVGVQL